MLRWIFGKSQILPSAASADCFCHHCCQHIAKIATITIIANIAIDAIALIIIDTIIIVIIIIINLLLFAATSP